MLKHTKFTGYGTFIRRYRQLCGMTQKDLASRIGVQPPQICAYEREKTSPNMQTLLLIAKALGVTTSHLTGELPFPKVNRVQS